MIKRNQRQLNKLMCKLKLRNKSKKQNQLFKAKIV